MNCAKKHACGFVASLVKLVEDQRRTINVQIKMIDHARKVPPGLPRAVEVNVKDPLLN